MADIPAGCKNTARGVARTYAALLGEVDGVRLLAAAAARGHRGGGGSYADADTATGVAVALAKDRLTGDFSAAEQVAGIVAKAVADG